MNTITAPALALTLAFLAPSALAAAPFDKGDANKGKATHEKQCAGCHIGRFGGDGSSGGRAPSACIGGGAVAPP